VAGKLLLAYERAHSSDMIEHPCTVCGRKDNPTDGEWICCGLCDGWVHFGCDHRYKVLPRSHLNKQSDSPV
jgi:hypothetical protein